MKVGIVNDVQMAQIILKHLVEMNDSHEVIWTAENGETAVKKAAKSTPDIILMDLLMPVMDGVEATKQIMEKSPCAILVVTSSVAGNMEKVFEAMGHGALDVVKTPSLDLDAPEESQDFLKKLDTIGLLLGEKKKFTSHDTGYSGPSVSQEEVPNLAVFGASTGGPMVLANLLSTFTPSVPFATVIIQHVDQEFSSAFSRWLEEQSGLPTRLIEHGEKPLNGHVYIAKEKAHLIINQQGHFSYSTSPEEIPYKPSVDVFFECVADTWPRKGVAGILTGMGSDGAVGLKMLKERGWLTLAQDKDSCVVYGMPKAAVEENAAQFILSPEGMGKMILKHFEQSNKKVSV